MITLLFHLLDDEIVTMFTVEIILLGLALAIDASVVSFAIGLLTQNSTTSVKIWRGTVCGLTFGLFQFLMMWLGSYGGFLFTFSKYGYLFQFLVALIFVLIGYKFFNESLKQEKPKLEWAFFPLLVLAIATSIDALAAGISLGTLPHAYVGALGVGLITVICCTAFFFFAQIFQHIPDKWLLRLASLILIGLGFNIIWSYLLKGSL
jgi:manganese efflux pump family protein